MLVLDVRQLHSDRAAAGCADKDTKRLQSASKRKRAQVRSLLEEIYVWGSVGGGETHRMTEQEVKSLFDPGQPMPWATQAADGPSRAVRLHHGRRCLDAAADLARTREEDATLRVEKRRIGGWVAHMLDCLGDARRRAQSCQGTIFLLDRWIALVEGLREELKASKIPES